MTKKIALCGILTSLAIAVSALERFIPLQAIIPIPGIKLGLSNCIILLSIYKLDTKCSFGIMLTKCVLVSFIFTGFTSLVYSLSGGILSVIGMSLLHRYPRSFSIYGISVSGASLHSLGQILAASIMLGSKDIFSYLSVLLIVSIITGIIVGLITSILNDRVRVSL